MNRLRKRQNKGNSRGGRGLNKPESDCVCVKCGTKIVHQRGITCRSLDCPKCGTQLVRE